MYRCEIFSFVRVSIEAEILTLKRGERKKNLMAELCFRASEETAFSIGQKKNSTDKGDKHRYM